METTVKAEVCPSSKLAAQLCQTTLSNPPITIERLEKQGWHAYCLDSELGNSEQSL